MAVRADLDIFQGDTYLSRWYAVVIDGLAVDHRGYPGAGAKDTTLVAVTVTVPDAVLRPQNYIVPAEAISEAGRHLRAERMMRVAQVHTHGDDWVEHSPTDDDRAYSQREGAISIVVPFHGSRRPTVAECGIHLRTPSGWRRSDGATVDAVVQVIPSKLDHRKAIWPKNSISNGGTFCRFLAWTKVRLRRLIRSTS